MYGMTRCTIVAVGILLAAPATSWGGMPAVTLSDVARWHLSTISFFGLGFLIAAQVVRWSWNRLSRDFPHLPTLTHGRACLLVTAWGFAFVLVLTMISGARELMTPGAWERSGTTYQLKRRRRTVNVTPDVREASLAANSRRRSEDSETFARRRERIRHLGTALEDYAAAHAGHFPATLADAGIPDSLATVPDLAAMKYVYVAGGLPARSGTPVVYEPNVFGRDCWVYLAGGVSLPMTLDGIQTLVDNREDE